MLLLLLYVVYVGTFLVFSSVPYKKQIKISWCLILPLILYLAYTGTFFVFFIVPYKKQIKISGFFLLLLYLVYVGTLFVFSDVPYAAKYPKVHCFSKRY